MQFIDLSKQQKLIREKINARIESVLDHGQYINGKEVFELEESRRDFLLCFFEEDAVEESQTASS